MRWNWQLPDWPDFRFDADRIRAAEAGAVELMADVYRNHAAPLDDQALFAWHAMLMNGRAFLDKHQGMHATPEVFAAHHAKLLNLTVSPMDVKPPDRPPPDKERGR